MKAKLMRRDPLVVLELTQDEAVMLRKALDAARGTSVEKWAEAAAIKVQAALDGMGDES